MKQEPKILYVDDEDYMLDCMAATFEIAELTIATAESGAKALELLSNSMSFKVIISDYRMPGMNGMEFLSTAAKLYPNTTRILCSAFIDGEDVAQRIADGTIHYFIHKPWDINQLISVVTTTLEKQQSPEEETSIIPKFMHISELAAQ